MRAHARKVGLDKPCTLCGQPIHHSYRGPVEGVCGRCTDRIARKHRGARPATGRTIVRRSGRRGGRTAWYLLGLATGLLAMYFAQPALAAWVEGLARG